MTHFTYVCCLLLCCALLPGPLIWRCDLPAAAKVLITNWLTQFYFFGKITVNYRNINSFLPLLQNLPKQAKNNDTK